MRTGAALVLLAAACRSGGSGGSGGSGTTALPEETRDPPAFVEPASGIVRLDTTRHQDLTVGVKSIYLGLTTLSIDGRSVGTLTEPNTVGLLTPDNLTLHLAGAMVAGQHSLELITPGTVETLHSQNIIVIIEPADAPQLAASLETGVVTTGSTLSAHGAIDEGVLVIFDQDTAQIRMLQATGATWNAGTLEQIEATGYVPDPGERSPAIAAALEVRQDASPRVRVVWRVGFPGTRIDGVALDWGGSASSPAPVIDLAEDVVPRLTGAVEWAALGRPALFGDTLVADLTAAHDSESKLPGDIGLVLTRYGGVPEQPGVATLPHPAGTIDVDLTGPTVDGATLRLGHSSALTVRLGRLEPAILDVDQASGNLGLRPTSLEGPAITLPRADSRLVGVTGAFGSRTLAALTEDGIRIITVDASASAGAVDKSPSADLLPDPGSVTGEIAGSLIRGAPVFLVPFGPLEPIHAVIATDSSTSVQPLAVSCDQVALPTTLAGNSEGALGFGCLVGGELRLGTLSAP